MKKNILVIGGTSGVGLELAAYYADDGHNVCATGRTDRTPENVMFQHLDLAQDVAALGASLDRVILAFPNVHTMIFAAGFLQRGTIDTLDDAALHDMISVGLLAPMMLAQRLKACAPTPLKIMLITSSSQYTPRALEPAYCAAKAGLGMLGDSLVRDPEIGKVLVAAPSGIATPFWDDTDEDTSTMLDAKWTAQQIVMLSSGAFKYKYAKILRNPPRVEVVEALDNQLRPI